MGKSRLQANIASPLPAAGLIVCRVLGGLGKWEKMPNDDSPSLSVDRRLALAGAMLMVALPLDRSAAAEPVGALPQDDAEFVTIDGWVLRRDDLVRHGG